MKTAILFGATGHVGSYLLQLLLNAPHYKQVTIVVRREVTFSHPKLTVLIGNIDSLYHIQHQLVADDVFITLGAADPIVERKYPVLAASLCHWKGANAIFVVTAVGADPNARMRYVRVKGEIEQGIASLGYKHTYFFRPAMIQGKREHYRPVEKMMMTIWKIIDPLFWGRLKKYKGMYARNIALAIYRAAQHSLKMRAVYHWTDMKRLADGGEQKKS